MLSQPELLNQKKAKTEVLKDKVSQLRRSSFEGAFDVALALLTQDYNDAIAKIQNAYRNRKLSMEDMRKKINEAEEAYARDTKLVTELKQRAIATYSEVMNG